jgi:predicted enzyme related to lactoylglutathione lyase
MPDPSTDIASKPVWVDLSTSDAAAAREFYTRLFGWEIEVQPDPQYGGYGMARLGGGDVAGIGPKQAPEVPTAWNLYIGTADANAASSAAQGAGGAVVMAPFDVPGQGRMAVLQDPSGAFVSVWQPARMGGVFDTTSPGTFGWAELNARGLDKAIRFYEQVFGWSARTSPGEQPYTEFQLGGSSIAGAMEMNPMVPAEVPSYWMVYFNVGDVDAAFNKATDAGAREMVPPQDFPGGRFAIVGDPQGAIFGLMKLAHQ